VEASGESLHKSARNKHIHHTHQTHHTLGVNLHGPYLCGDSHDTHRDVRKPPYVDGFGEYPDAKTLQTSMTVTWVLVKSGSICTATVVCRAAWWLSRIHI
jgi:hypothetical protein